MVTKDFTTACSNIKENTKTVMYNVTVFTGCGDTHARIFAGKSGSLARELRGHDAAINALQVKNSSILFDIAPPPIYP